MLVWVWITGQRFPRYHTIDHVYRFEASHTPAEVLKTVTLLDTPGILAGNWIGVSSKKTAFACNVLVKKKNTKTNIYEERKYYSSILERNSWSRGIYDFSILLKIYFTYFLSDPGKPGVRSMGPLVCLFVQDVCKT